MDHRESVPLPEQGPIDMDMAVDEKPEEDSSGMVEVKRREKGDRGGERGKAGRKQKDCFGYSGGSGSSSSSSSSSNTGSSSSESEVEQQDRQRQIDQWNLKRPGIMENTEAGKRQRNA